MADAAATREPLGVGVARPGIAGVRQWSEEPCWKSRTEDRQSMHNRSEDPKATRRRPKAFRAGAQPLPRGRRSHKGDGGMRACMADHDTRTESHGPWAMGSSDKLITKVGVFCWQRSCCISRVEPPQDSGQLSNLDRTLGYSQLRRQQQQDAKRPLRDGASGSRFTSDKCWLQSH